jgi:hypothetical protein
MATVQTPQTNGKAPRKTPARFKVGDRVELPAIEPNEDFPDGAPLERGRIKGIALGNATVLVDPEYREDGLRDVPLDQLKPVKKIAAKTVPTKKTKIVKPVRRPGHQKDDIGDEQVITLVSEPEDGKLLEHYRRLKEGMTVGDSSGARRGLSGRRGMIRKMIEKGHIQVK